MISIQLSNAGMSRFVYCLLERVNDTITNPSLESFLSERELDISFMRFLHQSC